MFSIYMSLKFYLLAKVLRLDKMYNLLHDITIITKTNVFDNKSFLSLLQDKVKLSL